MGNFLKKIMPFVGAAATGNVPALVSLAMKTVGDVVGKKIDGVDDLEAAVAGATPEQLAALRAAENDFKLKMQALGFEHEEDILKIESEDRASARQREMSVKDRIPAILACSVTLGFFGLLFTLLFYRPPQDNQALFNIMLGSLGTAWTGIIAYYFGSSAGSAKKDETLARVVAG